MSRIWVGLLLLAAAVLAGPSAAQAPAAPAARVALVIGNALYPGAGDVQTGGLRLPNTINDIRLVGDSLRRAGFAVDTLMNADKAEMARALAAFDAKARNADAAVVYFAGAGFEIDGVNYFLPVDLRISDFQDPSNAPSSDRLNATAIPVSQVVAGVRQARRFGMVMADAGRDNPWLRPTRGLASLAENGDVLILYSSAAGELASDGTGANGPFATAVAKYANEPGLEIAGFVRKVRSEVLRLTDNRQHPTSYGELSDREFYFVAPPPQPAPAAIVFSDQPRLALVIGNGDYNGDGDFNDDRESDAVVKDGFANDLPNTLNDARAMRDALLRLHFTPENIVYVENGDKAAMTAALLRFSQKIRVTGSDALVLVYYAGHAIQINGANFLIPVKGKLPPLDMSNMTEEEVEIALRDYAVPISDLVSRLRNPSSLGANVVILDACRNNPWETRTRAVGSGGATRGLADIPNGLRRTAFAFATKPGDTALDGDGANSPYMTVMKRWIERPGLTIRDLFDGVGNDVVRNTSNRQVPWLNSPPMGATCLGACAVPQ